ncbi:MAG TPA: hypothetical protein VI112_17065, partial [Bacteroidia bacterium]
MPCLALLAQTSQGGRSIPCAKGIPAYLYTLRKALNYFVQRYLPLDNEDLSKLREEKNLETALSWTFGLLFLLIFWFISDLFEMGIYWKMLWGSVIGVIYFFLAIGMNSSRKDKQKEFSAGQKLLIAGTANGKLKEP